MLDLVVSFWDWSPVLFLLFVAVVSAIFFVTLAIGIYIVSICRERGIKDGLADIKSGLMGTCYVGSSTADIQSNNPFGG